MKRALLLLALLASVPSALAHAEPFQSEPAGGARLESAPTEVWVDFTEPVFQDGSWIRVIDQDGARVDDDDLRISGPAARPRLTVGLDAIGDGAYRIEWQTYSKSDGHTINGAIGFAVGGFAPPATTTDAEAQIDLAPAAQIVWNAESDRLLTYTPTQLQIWDLQSRQPTIIEPSSPITTVALSPIGDAIALGHADGTTHLLDPSGNPIAQLSGPDRPVRQLVFSANGQAIATLHSDGTTQLWDSTGSLIIALERPQFIAPQIIISDLALNLTGTAIATRSRSSGVTLWDTTGTAIATLDGHQDWIIDMVPSPSGDAIATYATFDAAVQLWTMTGQSIATLEHPSWIDHIHFSPDGSAIATLDGIGTAHLWQVDGSPIARSDGTEVDHLAFSPQGHLLALSQDNGTVLIWDRSGNIITQLEGHQGSPVVAFDPSGEAIATLDDTQTLRLWTVDGRLLSASPGV